MSPKLPEVFIPFLDSLGFKPHGTNPPLVELRGDVPASTASGESFINPALGLFQHSTSQVTLAGFRQKFLHLLRDANHVANEAIVDAILGCAVGAAQSGSERAAFLEKTVEQFREVEVSHFFVLPVSAGTEPTHFDGYSFGAIDIPVLSSRCNRARSDYAQLYSQQLAGRFCLQSPIFKHVVINFVKLGSDSGLFADSHWRELLLNYFERTSRQHFEFMWAHLDRTQVLGAPFNAHFVDVQNLRNEMGKFAHRITIYLEFSRKGGYVVPESGGIVFNQPGPNSEAFARFEHHRSKYGLSDIGDSELSRTLLTCAGFCQQAIRFLESGRADDAALYSTICLEHLFSEKTSIAQKVCSRTAALAFLRLSTTYSEAEREMQKLYDARSAFVHSGVPVTPAQAERLIAYACETLRSLLVLNLVPANRAEGFLAKWIKDLDFIASGFAAGRNFEESLLVQNGIFGP